MCGIVGDIYFDNLRKGLSATFTSSMPRPYMERTSPIPTVSIMKGIASVAPYPKARMKGTINALDSTGGNAASHLFLRSQYVPRAPISVAMGPQIMSRTTADPNKLARKQPRVTPGMAAGVKTGSRHSASENRTCITLLSRPSALAKKVSATYSAAIRAAWQMYRVLFDLYIKDPLVLFNVRMVTNSRG